MNLGNERARPRLEEAYQVCEGCGRELPLKRFWPKTAKGPHGQLSWETHCRECAPKRPPENQESTRVDIVFHHSPARRISLRKRMEQNQNRNQQDSP